jgi:stage II sporulation protein D
MFQYLKLLKENSWLLTLSIWMLLILPSQAAVEMRVAIKKGLSKLTVGSSTLAVVRDGSGRKLGEISSMNSFLAQTSGNNIVVNNLRGSQIFIEPTNNGYVWIGDRWYRGVTRLVREGGKITAINNIDLEKYLYSVVGAEAYASWPIEALKAQAVSARSYALYKRLTSGNSLYDVDTSTVTQVYKGLDSEYVTTHTAVDSTTGQVMTHNNKVILAVFHSSSGGHTENVEDIWTSRLPYLRGVIDYDQQAPVYQWTKPFSASQINGRFGVGKIVSIAPEKITPQGRVISMKVVGDRGTKKFSGSDIRNMFDLPSTLFNVYSDGNNFQIYGRGYGHGIGLSQWGAYYLAAQGVNYQTILAHYYQNATLAQMK